MMKYFLCVFLSLFIANASKASNDYTIDIEQSSPLSSGKFKVKAVIRSTAKKDIVIPEYQLPSSTSEHRSFYLIVVVDGVGETFPKYSAGYPAPDVALKKGETKVEEITVESKLLLGKDAKKTLIKFVWVDNSKDVRKNAGVLTIR